MIVRSGKKTVHKSTTIPTINVAQPVGYRYYSPPHTLITTGGSPGNQVTQSGVRDIVYTTRPKGDNFVHSNVCIHTKTSFKYTGDQNTWQRVNDLRPQFPGYFYEYYNGHYWSLLGHALAVAACKTAFGVTLGPNYLFGNAQAFINDAASKMKPDLTKVDAINFALQAGSIKSLYFGYNKTHGLVKNVAKNFLALKFGLLPDQGDLRAAVKGLLDLRKRIDAFNKTIDTIIRGRKVLVSDTIVKTGSVNPGTQYALTYWNGLLARKVEAFIYYRPEHILALGEVDIALRASMATLGIELNPRVVWDALPFSFVVDWFFNVGKVLERYKIPALELPISYVDSSVQYTQQMTIRSYTGLDFGNPNSSSTTWPDSYTTEDLFCRMPIFPDYSTLTGIGYRNPTANQAVLLLALGTVLT